VTNKGINPGGDHTVIVYDSYMGADGVPRGMEHHMHELDAAYYRGEKPVFAPGIFATRPSAYAAASQDTPRLGSAFDYPVREGAPADLPRLDLIDADNHRTRAEACREKPRTLRKLYLRAGRAYARNGEVFGFEPRMLSAARCEEVELIFENNDPIRHDFMINGLSPAFSVNLAGLGTTAARFVTPDENVTLTFHCHVPMHDRVGMSGLFRVGAGSPRVQVAQASEATAPAATYEGVGTVIATVPRMGRLIVDHEEIEGFMGAMEMSYPVVPPALLEGLSPGDRIGFTIDAQAAKITGVKVLQKAN
jgi:Cu/Ag efflux protein CusF